MPTVKCQLPPKDQKAQVECAICRQSADSSKMCYCQASHISTVSKPRVRHRGSTNTELGAVATGFPRLRDTQVETRSLLLPVLYLCWRYGPGRYRSRFCICAGDDAW